MATNYPGALDALANPSATDSLDTPGVEHDVQHANANDAIEALQKNAVLALVYASGAYPTRPAGVNVCHFFGPVQPTGWQAGDLWTDNS